jgi:hypothetical protein
MQETAQGGKTGVFAAIAKTIITAAFALDRSSFTPEDEAPLIMPPEALHPCSCHSSKSSRDGSVFESELSRVAQALAQVAVWLWSATLRTALVSQPPS